MFAAYWVAFGVPFHEWVPDPQHAVYSAAGLMLAMWAGVALVATWYMRNFHDLVPLDPTSPQAEGGTGEDG